MPSESVDSQIGPSTRVGAVAASAYLAVPAGTPAHGRPSEVSATTGGAPHTGPAGSARSSRHRGRPGARRDRARGGRRRRASRHARRGTARARSRGGPAAGRAGVPSSSAGSSPANRAGPGAGSPAAKTGKPPPTSSVSNVPTAPRHSAVTASARRTASRQASTAPSCEPTCRWMPRGRSGPRDPPPASMAAASSVSFMPNLDAAGADRETGQRLGRDVRVEPVEDVERAPTLRPRSGRWPPARPPPQAIRARPSATAGRSRTAMAAACRSASVLPIPSSVIRSFGRPARVAAPTRRATRRSRRSRARRPRRRSPGRRWP